MDIAITSAQLKSALLSAQSSNKPPLLIDVRRIPAFTESTDVITGALYRNPEHINEWASSLPRASSVVVYCVHGHQVSQGAAQALNEHGVNAQFLEGGIAHWLEDGGTVMAKPAGAHSRWVTRERPKIDRIACPWLIARFLDPAAKFFYVEPAEVINTAKELDAIPYDVDGVELTHRGERDSFDAILEDFGLKDAALDRVAAIVRGADTARLDLAPEAAGLLAISLGISHLAGPEDHEALERGFQVYDALYAWARYASVETHNWPTKAKA